MPAGTPDGQAKRASQAVGWPANNRAGKPASPALSRLHETARTKKGAAQTAGANPRPTGHAPRRTLPEEPLLSTTPSSPAPPIPLSDPQGTHTTLPKKTPHSTCPAPQTTTPPTNTTAPLAHTPRRQPLAQCLDADATSRAPHNLRPAPHSLCPSHHAPILCPTTSQSQSPSPLAMAHVLRHQPHAPRRAPHHTPNATRNAISSTPTPLARPPTPHAAI